MELSKRANLHGVREVRGVLRPDAGCPSGFAGADWSGMCELRADATDPAFWNFTGEASVVDHPYSVFDAFGEFRETIKPGAFKRTLAADPVVSFVYMHDLATVMAQTRTGNLTLSADPNLSVVAKLDKTDVDVQRVAPKVLRGDANSMSFAFRVTKQVWNEDYTERDILEVNLQGGDVSIITTGHGANPAASGSMRSTTYDDVLRFLDESLADLEDEQRAALAAYYEREAAPVPPAEPIPETPQSIREDLAKLYGLLK